jgi:hypothetical protein
MSLQSTVLRPDIKRDDVINLSDRLVPLMTLAEAYASAAEGSTALIPSTLQQSLSPLDEIDDIWFQSGSQAPAE